MCVEERLRSGNLLQRISDAIKRPFYSGAGGVHGYDDRDRNSSSDTRWRFAPELSLKKRRTSLFIWSLRCYCLSFGHARENFILAQPSLAI
jgi:hypothetical protein